MTAPNLPSINDYGSGVLIDAVPLVDPASEMSADNLNKLRNDCAAANQTVPKLIFQFYGTSSSSVPLASTATWAAGFDSQWGNNQLYAPVITRSSQGILSVQLPTQVPDLLTQTNPALANNNLLIRARSVKVWVSSGNISYNFITQVTSASTFGIQIMLASGTYTDAVGTLFTVEVD